MTDAELVATLALTKLPKVGCITARKLIRYFGSAQAVFDKIHATANPYSKTISNAFKQVAVDTALLAAEKEVARIQKHHINWIDFRQESYPSTLNQCSDAPLVLFYSGQPIPNTTRIISVVGTRQPSHQGRVFVRKLIEELAAFNPVIVSGFAYGIDIEAQLAARENNLITYGCLGHGILNCYPKEHIKYRSDIEQTGGFLSEFWSNEAFQRTHFLRRNRIIAGLAQATIVVESKNKGGALTTAYYALGYQREVFAVPGRPDDMAAQGCIDLIKTQQAACITSGIDVANALGWTEQTKPIYQPKLFVELNDKEKLVLAHMSEIPKHIDLIALEASIKVGEVASLLFQLEMKGAVVAQAGKQFKTT